MITMSIGSLITLFGIILGVIVALIGVIWKLLNDKIMLLAKDICEIKEHSSRKDEVLFNKIDDIIKGQSRLEVLLARDYVEKIECRNIRESEKCNRASGENRI